VHPVFTGWRNLPINRRINLQSLAALSFPFHTTANDYPSPGKSHK
jgi:hypothetical protein